MEKIKPTKLAIAGKVIDISKIGEKTLAQFRAQLKQNGIVLEEESLERLYHLLRDTEPVAEEPAAEETPAEETAEQVVEPKNEEE